MQQQICNKFVNREIQLGLREAAEDMVHAGKGQHRSRRSAYHSCRCVGIIHHDYSSLNNFDY